MRSRVMLLGLTLTSMVSCHSSETPRESPGGKEPPSPVPLGTTSSGPTLSETDRELPRERPPLPHFESTQARSIRELAERFTGWARDHKLRARVAVLDLRSRRWLVESGADELENPASNQKLLTAAATLSRLGPNFRFRTSLFAKIGEKGAAEIAVRGGGAPDFTTADLDRFARLVGDLGVREVERLTIDQSLFDTPYVPPAFDQQPGEWAAFRAPISALSVDRNAITLQVVPSAEGQPAIAWFEPPGITVVKGTIVSGKKGTGDKVRWTLGATPGRAELRSELGGEIEVGFGRQRYGRRVEDPRPLPGLALAALLRARGMTVKEPPRPGSVEGLEPLSFIDSEPLSVLLRELGKDSDNFTAETLLVALSKVGEEKGAKGKEKAAWSTASGLRVLTEFLKETGVTEKGPAPVLVNGSGLFDANRVTVRQLALVLAEMERKPELFAEYLSHLATAGVDGTLKKRLLKAPRVIRAKTGTLRDVTALSGYVLGEASEPPLAFSVILAGSSLALGEGRKELDAFVLGLAETKLKEPDVP